MKTLSDDVVDTFDPPSGIAHVKEEQYLLVHDTKNRDPEGPRFSTYDELTGEVRVLPVDWNGREVSNDLEAIVKIDQNHYLAAEGARYGTHKPQLFFLEKTDDAIKVLNASPLPDSLPYDIEGLALHSVDQGEFQVLLGGRGGKGHNGRLHWASLNSDNGTLDWNSAAGLNGIEVESPVELGDSQRPIADLHLGPNGNLWAVATTDPGDDGPFDSLLYRLGELSNDSDSPVKLTRDKAVVLDDLKIEALASSGQVGAQFLVGADNENIGGVYMTTLDYEKLLRKRTEA